MNKIKFRHKKRFLQQRQISSLWEKNLHNPVNMKGEKNQTMKREKFKKKIRLKHLVGNKFESFKVPFFGILLTKNGDILLSQNLKNLKNLHLEYFWQIKIASILLSSSLFWWLVGLKTCFFE